MPLEKFRISLARGKKGVTVKLPWNNLRKGFLLATSADRTNPKWMDHQISWKSLQDVSFSSFFNTQPGCVYLCALPGEANTTTIIFLVKNSWKEGFKCHPHCTLDIIIMADEQEYSSGIVTLMVLGGEIEFV